MKASIPNENAMPTHILRGADKHKSDAAYHEGGCYPALPSNDDKK
jgi:hypothetical protein